MKISIAALFLIMAPAFSAAGETPRVDLVRAFVMDWSSSDFGFPIEEEKLGTARVIPNLYGACVRFPLLFGGVPLAGGEVVVETDMSGNVTRASASPLPRPGDIIGWLEHGPGRPPASAVRAIGAFLEGIGVELRDDGLRPVVLPLGGEYFLSLSFRYFTGRPFGLWELFFDFATGEPLWARNLARAANQGNVYPINPVESEVAQVELTGLGGDGTLTGTNTKVFNCVVRGGAECAAEQVARDDENGDFLYIEPDAKDPTDSFAEVNMFYHVETMHEYFAGFGFTGFGQLPLMALVNYRTDANGDGDADPYDNAAFIPGGWGSPFGNNPGMIFGQGAAVDFALDATVIAHEFTHSIIGETSNLDIFKWDDIGLNTLPLAINEGSADYFAASKLGTSKIGSYIAGGIIGADALRDLDNDLACPRGLSGEPHEDGKIWGGALWDIRGELGTELGNSIIYTIVTTIPSDSDFKKAGRHAVDKTKEVLGEEAAAKVREIMEARGVLDCERIVPLTEEPHSGILLGKELLGSMSDKVPYIPASIEYILELPRNTQSVRLKMVTLMPPAGTDARVFVRKGEIIKNSIRMLQLKTEKDFEIAGDKTYDMGASYGDAVFEAGNTYYFQPVNYGMPTTQYGLSMELFLGEPLPDAGADRGGGKDEGCSCGAAASGFPIILGMLLLALAGILRKR